MAFLVVTVLLASGWSSTPSWARLQGEMKCHPRWKFCLETGSISPDGAYHYVSGIRVKGQYMEIPTNGSFLEIRHSDGAVLFVSSNRDPVVIGKVTRRLKEDTDPITVRRMIPAARVKLKEDVRAGDDMERCKRTALAIVTERRHYHTMIHLLSILQKGEVIGKFSKTDVVEPAFSTTSSVFGCLDSGYQQAQR